MAVVFGTSNKGKVTVIYRNFEYVKERDNHCGTTSPDEVSPNPDFFTI